LNILNKVLGSHSEKEIKKIKPTVLKIIKLEEAYGKLSNEELKHKTVQFKERLKNGETLDNLLIEAFATVREASWRVLGLKPYEVQVMGGIILHKGKITEMKTGEGKTLVATLPIYLNALEGKGAYVVTVNDYLAKRDSEQMGKVYTFLGLTVGIIEHNMFPNQRKEQYGMDITYATNNEIGFDYLKDNMVSSIGEKVQRPFNFAIIDEVDSILIDEARTPLIISGEGDDISDAYKKADIFIKGLVGICIDESEDKASRIEEIIKRTDVNEKYKDFDYTVNEKHKTVALTDRGISNAEKYYGIENFGDMLNVEINHYTAVALKANATFKRDIDYVVKDGEIMIVDEHTGRLMPGRRYSEGIHQAIETKEGVDVKKESKTLATISFQNLFKKFEKLSGMTGTAMTEEEEFKHTYALDIVEIPTNKPLIRIDKTDKVYRTKQSKFNAIVNVVKECNKKGQPILIGTASVESSEIFARLFKDNDIKYTVLNAKYHEQEAQIIAQAGEYKAVTIATNMAGRGTDIMLGGNADYKAKQELLNLGYSHRLIEESTTYTITDDKEILEVREVYKELYKIIEAELEPKAKLVKSLGGLYILGTERHSSRRIDNQLRGRAGRQGDPGSSEFIVSLEDDLMRLFGADRLSSMFKSFNIPEDVPIDAKIISNSIEQAQKRIEGMHFGSRKSLTDYDSVMNLQREIIYKQRDEFLAKDSVSEDLIKLMSTFVADNVNNNISSKQGQGLTLKDQESIVEAFQEIIGLEKLPNYTLPELSKMNAGMIIEGLISEIKEKSKFFEQHTIKAQIQVYEKNMLLFLMDDAWQTHIVSMDELKEGIGLRAYAQKDPVMAYKTEGFKMFESLLNYVRKNVLSTFMSNFNNMIETLIQSREDAAIAEKLAKSIETELVAPRLIADESVEVEVETEINDSASDSEISE